MATEQQVADALSGLSDDLGTLQTDVNNLVTLAQGAKTDPALLDKLVASATAMKTNVDGMKTSIEAVTNPAPATPAP